MPEEKEEKLSQRTDYKLSEKEKEAPKFGLVIKLTEDQKADLFKRIYAEIEVIDEQRKALNIESDAASYRNQYWGILADKNFPYSNSFSLHVPLTMKHTNQVKVRTKQAFFESDPIWSVSPRPGEAKQEGFKIAKDTEEFLDYEADVEMRVRANMAQTFHEWSLLGVGYIKLPWAKKEEQIWDEYTYKGTKGLQELYDNYGEENVNKDYPGYARRLQAGNEISLMEEYTAPVYNAPLPTWVKYEDFYIDTRTNGMEGQRTAHLQGERLHWNWFDLKRKVEEDFFKEEDVEYLRWDYDKDGRQLKISPDYISKEYDIRENIYYYKLPKDKKETKIVVWLDYEKKKILRVIHFPYWHRRSYYIPLFFTTEKAGWYQFGMGHMMKDPNIAANAIMNFMLDTAFIQNLILFKVKKDSEMWRLMLSRKWYPGFPIGWEDNPDEIQQFQLQKQDLGSMLALFVQIQKFGEDISMVPTYMTGKESPTDPTAPAAKTKILLSEGYVGVKEYINNALPSMNELAFQTMELFYQFSEEGRQYRVLGKGEQAFKKIPREALRLRTDYQSQAYQFDFDKMNEARVGLTLFQMFGNDPEITQNPMGRYNFIYEIFKQMGANWDKKVDKILMSPEEREKHLIKTLSEAVKKYVQDQNKEAERMAKRNARKQELTASNMPAQEVVRRLDAEFPPPEPTQTQGQMPIGAEGARQSI